MVDGDKRELFAERAESLFLSLKQRFPGLTQTTLDTSKILCNKVQSLGEALPSPTFFFSKIFILLTCFWFPFQDVGKSILESYSRVLESLAFNIVARIDDLLYVDDLNKQSDKHSSIPTVSVIAHKRVSIPYSVPVSGTPQKTLGRSPAPLISPARGERTPFLHHSNNNNSKQLARRGFGVKRVLNNYLGVETKTKNSGNPTEGGPDSITSAIVVAKNMQHKKESVIHQAKLRVQ